jgi:hypothetical protein
MQSDALNFRQPGHERQMVMTVAAIPDQTGKGTEPATQERLVGTYGEVRTTLAFEVSSEALQHSLPAGWMLSRFDLGPSKGANLVVSLVEQVVVQDAEGKPQDNCLIATLSCSARRTVTDAVVTMVLAGLASSGRHVPGVYRNFVLADTIVERAIRIDSSRLSGVRESWEFRGNNADGLVLELAYARGQPVRSLRSAIIHSATLPEIRRIYRIDQAVDTVYSAALRTNRLQNYAFRTLGDRFARLFDGTERLISVAASPCYSRRVFVPC